MHGKSTASYSPTKPAAICLIELCTTASSVSSETSANLGHATAAFTLDVYGHFTDDMRSVSAQRMEGFITNVLNL